MLSSIFLLCVSNLVSGQIRYSVPEELEPGAFVGNIAKDLGFNVEDLSDRGLRIISDTQTQYLDVNLQSGILFVSKRIDREQLCGENPTCFLALEVVIEKPMEQYHVEVEILDINDNSPSFSSREIRLEIVESVLPGARFLLKSAKDPDVGLNSIRTYQLTPNEYFILDVQTRGEWKLAELVLEKPLDREKQSSHQLLLTAIDGGSPEKSGTTLIIITVLDINDNAPIFHQSLYTVSLVENIPVGTLVIKLNATDLDDGSNGDIVYSFSNYGKDRVRELFNVDPHTGEIRVKGKLDFEEANVYEINVEARDRGPHPLPVHCTVLVDIRDVNDNAPELTLISTSDTVREDALPGTMVALISVSDRDSEENGKTKCEIEKHLPFDIKSSFKNSYRIVTTDPLDRESISEYKITIMCEDSGSPPLSANKTILVHISDINDNAPYFPQNSYTAYIMENNVPGTSIYSVTAMDPDLTDSSHIHYSILETWIKGLPVSSFASIDSGNGIIFSQTSFDYEQLKNFQIQVQAQDDGSPPLCGNVTVNVIILDQNDNPPVVTSPRARNPSEMLVPLSAPPGYLVTKVTATDADSGQNARLSYRLVQATDPSIFTLTHGSGEIRTARRLEDKDALKQTLIILVRDSGHPPLSSTVTIALSVVQNIAEVLSDYSDAPPKNEHSLNLAFYIIVSLGILSSILLVTIIALVVTICHNARGNSLSLQACCARENKSNDRFQHSNFNLQMVPESKLITNYVEVRGSGSRSETLCYKVQSAPEHDNVDFMLFTPYSPETHQSNTTDPENHATEYIRKSLNNRSGMLNGVSKMYSFKLTRNQGGSVCDPVAF
eukprot:gi/632967869/ref/XP_007900219.1/ PREDICTED: protocadherin-10-like [Callorhinchus milii]